MTETNKQEVSTEDEIVKQYMGMPLCDQTRFIVHACDARLRNCWRIYSTYEKISKELTIASGWFVSHPGKLTTEEEVWLAKAIEDSVSDLVSIRKDLKHKYEGTASRTIFGFLDKVFDKISVRTDELQVKIDNLIKDLRYVNVCMDKARKITDEGGKDLLHDIDLYEDFFRSLDDLEKFAVSLR